MLLDGLRLLAALSVVLYHYAFRSLGADGLTDVAIPSISHIARYGYVGVYLFFIISGFVIACSAENRTAMAFALSRGVRIYPGFLLCMTATALAMALFADPKLVVTWDEWAGNLLIDASLFGRGDAGRRKVPMSPDELLEAGVLVYLRGLGLQGDPVAP